MSCLFKFTRKHYFVHTIAEGPKVKTGFLASKNKNGRNRKTWTKNPDGITPLTWSRTTHVQAPLSLPPSHRGLGPHAHTTRATRPIGHPPMVYPLARRHTRAAPLESHDTQTAGRLHDPPLVLQRGWRRQSDTPPNPSLWGNTGSQLPMSQPPPLHNVYTPRGRRRVAVTLNKPGSRHTTRTNVDSYTPLSTWLSQRDLSCSSARLAPL